jgi:AraC family transcriptional regulator, exoenzyme S synthesis regulatory protein ExsA
MVMRMDRQPPGSSTKGQIFVSCKREKHYSRELTLDQHALVYIYSGILEIACADRSFTFGRGDVLLLPRYQLARLAKLPADGEPFRSVSILFPEAQLRSFYATRTENPAERRWTGPMVVNRHALLDGFFESLIPYFGLQEDLPSDLAAIKIGESLTLLDAYDPKVRRILGALEEPGKIDLAAFMEQNFMFNLPLERFSYLTGRSLTTFKKDFKNIFHTTPGRWLMQKRLERAHYQIGVQGQKPGDVYIALGFENLSHFSFAFKKRFGVSPMELHVGIE